MLIQRGYKYELKVNNKERTRLAQCAGTARFAWNWGLAERNERYHTKQGPERFTDAMQQHKHLNVLKRRDFSWMYNYSKCVPQEALRDLAQAFTNFYQNRKERHAVKTKRYMGFPKFKKKERCKDSFRLTGTIRVFSEKQQIQLPRLGKLRVKEPLCFPPSARILNATISRTANRWYVAFTTEVELPPPTPKDQSVVGLDAGLKRFATLSQGLPIPAPKFLLRKLRKLRHLSKAYSRKEQGSKNQRKAADQLARFYRKVTNSRQDFLHKTSTYLTKNHSVIIGEDLYLKGLIRNKKFSKSWTDLAHGTFQRMVAYKSAWKGGRFIQANRWFPSSKLCSICWYYHPEFTLAERVFKCPLCGVELDRDYNAALNLENYYYLYQPVLGPVAESSAETINASGEGIRPTGSRRASKKQETQYHRPGTRQSRPGRDG